jgi:hypothetical protein
MKAWPFRGQLFDEDEIVCVAWHRYEEYAFCRLHRYNFACYPLLGMASYL